MSDWLPVALSAWCPLILMPWEDNTIRSPTGAESGGVGIIVSTALSISADSRETRIRLRSDCPDSILETLRWLVEFASEVFLWLWQDDRINAAHTMEIVGDFMTRDLCIQL